jgi:hypothetical protein
VLQKGALELLAVPAAAGHSRGTDPSDTAGLKQCCESIGGAAQLPAMSAAHPSTMRAGFCPKMSICRLWLSELRWHLNPFSSRHCFWHICIRSRSGSESSERLEAPHEWGSEPPELLQL